MLTCSVDNSLYIHVPLGNDRYDGPEQDIVVRYYKGMQV